MGYYSELKALVHGSDLIEFKAALEAADLKDCFEEVSSLGEHGYAEYRSNASLKWYDHFTDVIRVNSVFQKSMLSCLVAVGEDGAVSYYHNPKSAVYDWVVEEKVVNISFDYPSEEDQRKIANSK